MFDFENIARFLLVILIVFAVSWKTDQYISQKKIQQTTTPKFETVKETFCQNRRRKSAFVVIHTEKGDYNVKISLKLCRTLSAGSSIRVFYDAENDTYFLPVSGRNYFTFLSVNILFLFLIFPWKFLSFKNTQF